MRPRRLILEQFEDRTLLAAVITVDSTADTNVRDAVLTLREAIEINNGTLAVASLTAQEQAQVVGTLSSSDADTIGFNILSTDSRHFYYQNDNVDGQVDLAKVVATAATDDNSIADIDPDWPHSWFSIGPNLPWPMLAAAAGPVIVDGYTQPGASVNTLADASNAILRIEIDGFIPPVGAGRLDIEAGGSAIRGLVVNRQGAGTTAIFIGGTGGSTVSGNFIGTDVSGTLARGNGLGIQASSDGNIIGGKVPAARNVISTNSTGVEIDGNKNFVEGNLIGLDRHGLANLANFSNGVFVQSGTENTIGGMAVGSRNVIVARSRGIKIASDSNTVQGNFIGTDVSGNKSLVVTTSAYGMVIAGTGNHIGSTLAGGRNVISGNDTGIRLDIALNTIVEGNFIGTNAAGTTAIGTTSVGIEIVNGSDNAIVGGTALGAGNLISGNGVGVQVGVAFNEFKSQTGVLVQGNLIGTDVTGTLDLGNLSDGIQIGQYANSVTIGGSDSTARNIISGNQGMGINIYSPGHTIRGNFIGTQIDGKSALGNGAHGIGLQAKYSLIGGPEAGDGNTIAFNGLEGVSVLSETFNRISGNSIYSNAELGIDLNTDGATPNDPDDSDAGPNNLQNFPVIAAAAVTGSQLSVSYSVPSAAANSAYPLRIEFFKADAGGMQGQTFLGSATYTEAQAGAAATAVFTPTVPIVAGDTIIATATDDADNTSEFGVSFMVQSCSTVVTNTDDSGLGSLREVITCANSTPGADTISFNIPGDGVHTISPLTALPAITDPITVDGYTQPGASPNTLTNGDNAKLLVELSGQLLVENIVGLDIQSDNSTIRGLVINQFGLPKQVQGIGISIAGSNNTIEGNFIGTTADGKSPRANSIGTRVGTTGTVQGTLVGGTTPAARNLISGNEYIGVWVIDDAPDTTIQGNFIGTDVTGAAKFADGSPNGISIQGSPAIVLGNVLSGNKIGIGINFLTTGSVIQGNLIGTDYTGTIDVGNDIAGVFIGGGLLDNPSNNLIGGTSPGQGNVIAYNGNGVVMNRGAENSVLGNSIHDNATLGIDLNDDGATANDTAAPADSDTGPNNLQNSPLVSYGTRDVGKLKVRYNMPSASPNSTYPIRIEFFLADNNGQGKTYLGFDTFNESDLTAGGKTVVFATVAPTKVFDKIVATATDSLAAAAGGGPANTSEFSPSATIVSPWKNSNPGRLRWDVDDDEKVTATDVIDVINRINARGSGLVPDNAANQPLFYDVDGDNNVVATDVIDIINYINSGRPQGGEAGPELAEQEASESDLLALMAMDIATAAQGKRRF